MHLAREQLNRLVESRIRAERKLGLLLRDSVARGGRGSKSQRAASTLGGSSRPLPPGITHMQSSRWQHLGNIPDEQFEDFFTVAWKEGSTISVEALWRFLRAKEPRSPRPDPVGDNLAWLLDAARRILDERVQLASVSASAVPTAARELRPDSGARDLLLDLRRSQQPQAWLKALQRHLAGAEERQAIVVLHVRALALVASSKAICVPTSPPASTDCVVAYYGRKLRAFALVFREVGTVLVPAEVS
jgi:hypothetical protein